ncbi:hypothetical protein AAG747_00625 [Rapidithrix thailandica]|uniref:Uncharacterized protein n=1 Tax=Rapidithrix thailandica TaxID=413964 RepID=A0AAW9RNK6_9BACT
MNALTYVLWSVFLVLSFLPCQGQRYRSIKHVPLNGITAISMDRNQKIYVADVLGQIKKYDLPSGQTEGDYSYGKPGSFACIDAWQTVRIFAFNADYQEYLLLDRQLGTANVQKLPPELIGHAPAAALATDNHIWLYDEFDMSIKKLDEETGELLINAPLTNDLFGDELQLNYMREYQNWLFVNDAQSGILVFDLLGNFNRRLDASATDFFSFWNNMIYFIHRGKLVTMDMYTQERKTYLLPEEVTDKVLLTSHFLVSFSRKGVRIFEADFEQD